MTQCFCCEKELEDADATFWLEGAPLCWEDYRERTEELNAPFDYFHLPKYEDKLLPGVTWKAYKPEPWEIVVVTLLWNLLRAWSLTPDIWVEVETTKRGHFHIFRLEAGIRFPKRRVYKSFKRIPSLEAIYV